MIKNPVTDYFPANTHKVTLSYNAPVQRLSSYLATVPPDRSIAVFVGAMAHGEDNFADDVVDEKISISEYSLSASVLAASFAVVSKTSGALSNAPPKRLDIDKCAT